MLWIRTFNSEATSSSDLIRGMSIEEGRYIFTIAFDGDGAIWRVLCMKVFLTIWMDTINVIKLYCL